MTLAIEAGGDPPASPAVRLASEEPEDELYDLGFLFVNEPSLADRDRFAGPSIRLFFGSRWTTSSAFIRDCEVYP
jgi:hypothetical protein